MPEAARFGLDLGSSYVKVVGGSASGRVLFRRARATGVDFNGALGRLLPSGCPADNGKAVLTGYGKHGRGEGVQMSEAACLARAFLHGGRTEGTLVDIGGQDAKVLSFEGGRLTEVRLNRRCASGTGSFAEYLMHRMRLTARGLNALALQSDKATRLNHYCTVFAATEIIDLLQKGTPLEEVARSIYVSMALRVRDIAPLKAPVFLSGGLVAHHPVFCDVFRETSGMDAAVVPHPKFYTAYGAFLAAAGAGE
jgi:(R)-2-hydroxyacyl-CoA dehydratese activating ATPase